MKFLFVCMVYLCLFTRHSLSLRAGKHANRKREKRKEMEFYRCKIKKQNKTSMRNSKNSAPTMIQDNGNLHLLRKKWITKHIHSLQMHECAQRCVVCLFNEKSRLPCHILSSSPFFLNFVHIFRFFAHDYAKCEEKNNFTQIYYTRVATKWREIKRNTPYVQECTVIFQWRKM